MTKMWSIGEGNGKPLQYSCLKNPINSMKKTKLRHWKMNSLSRNVSNMLLGKSGEIAPGRGLGQNRNDAQLWMCLVVKAWCCKQQYCTETWNVRSMNQIKCSHAGDGKIECRLLAAAAAAKSLQSCPTLCDPIDGSPPGSPVPGILQARTLEWVAIAFSKTS